MRITFFEKFKENERNKKMQQLKLRLIKDLKTGHGYSLLRSSNTLVDNENIFNFAKQVDELGYMSQELGEELDKLFENDDYAIGIHRTGYTYMTQNILNDMFNNGLINNGHIGSGAMSGTTDIERTVSFYPNFSYLNHQLKAASGYKSSQGCIIVKIPKSYLGQKQGNIKPIFYNDGVTNRLLPEFIYGYVPVQDNKLGNIVHNPKYNDIHNYSNEGLIFDESVYYKMKRENNLMPKENKYIYEEKYNRLAYAYRETLKKYGERQAQHALISFINDNNVQYFTGEYNRAYLKTIPHNEIIKVLMFGSDFEYSDINSIIQSFHKYCNEEVNNSQNMTR